MAIMAIMKSATISELKNRLSAYLAMVRAGEPVLVLDRDVPVAIIQKVAASADSDPRALKLERAGLLKRPASEAPIDLETLRQPAPRATASVLDALIEERRLGR